MSPRIPSPSLVRRIVIGMAAIILGTGLSLSGTVAAQAASRCEPDSGANFAEKTPTIAQLKRVSLRCADFRNATIRNVSFEQADLTGADFRKATIVNSDFEQATLDGSTFAGATMTETSFEQAHTDGLVLTGIDAPRVDFEQVDLTGVSLKGARLRDADFSQATLKRADLSGADLRDASLNQTDLAGANLSRADIAGADLTEATTTGTTTSGVTGLTPLDLFGAIVALIVALLILRPRMRRGVPGRGAAWLVVLVFAGLTAAQVFAAAGWEPTGAELFVLPFLTPVVILALYIARVIRRTKEGWAAAGVAFIGLLGFYFLTVAGLAFLTDDLFGLLPFANTCSSVACGYGAARAPVGILVGLVLIVGAALLSRLKSLAKPAPNLARWVAMQRGGGRVAAGITAASGQAQPGRSDDHNEPPSSQTI